MSTSAQIRLWADGASPKHWHVEVNGQEISSAVRRATLNLAVDDAATLELEVYPNKIELPEPVLMELRARPAEPRFRRWLRMLVLRGERAEYGGLQDELRHMGRELRRIREELDEVYQAAAAAQLVLHERIPVQGAAEETEQPA